MEKRLLARPVDSTLNIYIFLFPSQEKNGLEERRYRIYALMPNPNLNWGYVEGKAPCRKTWLDPCMKKVLKRTTLPACRLQESECRYN